MYTLHFILQSTFRLTRYSFCDNPLTVYRPILYLFPIMNSFLPPSRPHRDRFRVEQALRSITGSTQLPVLLFIRGHYLNGMGIVGKDDLNIYDDSCYLVGSDFRLFESYNANTNPSFVRRRGRALAQLNLGEYRFYRGKHRGRYDALRAFPEGVKLPCTREGKPSTAQYINIHKGGTNPNATDRVWSEGCLTIPDTQYPDFISRVYTEMTRASVSTIQVILLENRISGGVQNWFDGSGRIVA